MTSTIRDVAKRAGVGVGTVSRVLNNSSYVSDATREHVLKVIAELDYRPNPFARNLSLGRSNAIGIITPFFTRPAFTGRLSGVQVQLAATEYDLILFSVSTPKQRDEYFRDIVSLKRVDGVLVVALGIDGPILDAFHNYKVPTVLLDTYHELLPSVTIDDRAGGRMATQHLINTGHTRIAYVGDSFENPFGFNASRYRSEGYRQALKDAGLPFNSAFHKLGNYGRYPAYELTLELLDLAAPPTAIFAASDTQAVGVLEALRSREMRVPEDVSVIGYDDIETAEYIRLTTMHQPMYASGQQAATLLLDLIAGEEPAQPHVVLPVELVERSTVGPPPG
jgi:DNA-binding LacI/PurR family transcriptional regulator